MYHLLFDRRLRQALNNHVIIVLTFINITSQLLDIPFILHYYRFQDTWKISIGFSLFSTLIDMESFSALSILFAWATIERHILIFHDRWTSTARRRFTFHYLPIIVLLLYCFIYYIIVIIIKSCPGMIIQNPILGVPSPCSYDDRLILMWDLVCHQILPSCIIGISSIALLLRILCQKVHLQRPIRWHKQRKMAIQIFLITILFMLNFPWTCLSVCLIFNINIDSNGDATRILFYFPYYIVLLFPIVCCMTLPSLRMKLKRLLICCRQQHRVIPFNTAQTHQNF